MPIQLILKLGILFHLEQERKIKFDVSFKETKCLR